jgi:AraC-like DNA-binding protein
MHSVRNFFDYFPTSPQIRSWGLQATSYGQSHVPPRTSYPSGRHPKGHHFDWEQGRTLQDYQIIYVHSGHGTFESSASKTRKICAGTIFILFPGIWHRYRPDFATGWTESWIELNGPIMDQFLKKGIIDPKKPVRRIQAVEEVEPLLESGHRLARMKPPLFSVRIAFLAAEILTVSRSSAGLHQSAPTRIEALISKAQNLLAKNLERNISGEQIAQDFGIAYSHFRRAFKRQTGFSPKQYRIEIRHRRVKDLLRNSSLTIKEISEQLGYNSTYHLSIDFSKRSGIPPTKWRLKDRPQVRVLPCGSILEIP